MSKCKTISNHSLLSRAYANNHGKGVAAAVKLHKATDLITDVETWASLTSFLCHRIPEWSLQVS